jgi:hypothetical protein
MNKRLKDLVKQSEDLGLYEDDVAPQEAKRPAPCTRHCEAQAFKIALRNKDARIAELEAKLYPAPQHPWGKPDATEIVVGLTKDEKKLESCDWSLLEATQASLREHMAEIGRLKVIIAEAEKREWVGLKDEIESLAYKAQCNTWTAVELTEAKLKDKNT